MVGDDHAACAHRRLAHKVRVVGQTRQDGLNDLAKVRRKAIAERDGEEDEERDVALADEHSRAPEVLQDGREQLLEAVDAEAGKDL